MTGNKKVRPGDVFNRVVTAFFIWALIYALALLMAPVGDWAFPAVMAKPDVQAWWMAFISIWPFALPVMMLVVLIRD